MNIDDRAHRAATDLLERAAARPVPNIDELVDAAPAPDRRRWLALGAVAATIALALLSVAIFRGGDDDVRTITTVPAPSGVHAAAWSPSGLGVTMSVPSTWVTRGPVAGFGYSVADPSRDPYVLADRIRNVGRLDVDAVGSARASTLQTLGAEDISTTTVDLGGRRAVEQRYRVPGTGGAADADVVEYDLVDGDWFFLVAAGEREPVDHRDVTEWIASTISLRTLDASETDLGPLEQPAAPLPAPVPATAWEPSGLGVRVQVPSTWSDMATVPSGFARAIQPPGGGPTVMVSRVSSAKAAEREADLRGIGAEIESTAPLTVDGHPASAIRYWFARTGYPLRVNIEVEYVIELGDGTSTIVNTAELDGGDDNRELLRWIRSTIEVRAR